MTLDRTGEPQDPDTLDEPPCICDGTGFADPDSDHPRPCPRHKPWLAPSRRRGRLWGASDPGPSNVDSDSRSPVAPWSDEHRSPRATGYPRTAETP